MKKIVFDGKVYTYYEKMTLQEFLKENEKNLIELPFIERVILYESIVYDLEKFEEENLM